jgi:hypothetical protein
MSYETKSSRRDQLLTGTTDGGKIELTEQELSRVAGGTALKLKAADSFLKIGFSTVFI